jgi:ParB-like chromosome segregation protein Spo0J
VINKEAASGDPTPPSTSPDVLRARRIEQWPIDELRPHPQQAALFHDLEGPEFDQLVESLKRGLDVPIEVTPTRTIIDGHQRVRAAQRLGWTKIRV